MAVDRHWSGYAWILTGFVDGVRRPLHKNNHRLIWNTAEEVREKVLEMQKEYLIELGDAVVAVKDDKGRIKPGLPTRRCMTEPLSVG